MNFESTYKSFGSIGLCIQARLSSTRLPGKVLFGLGNSQYNALTLMLSRLRFLSSTFPFLDNIHILTTNKSCDDAIVDLANSSNVSFYRGSADDVLSRYLSAANHFQIDTIVRLTSDCPFIDPEELIRTLKIHFYSKSDYTTNTFLGSSIVDGFDVEVFSRKALEVADKFAILPSEREHVTFYFKEENDFKCTLSDPNLDYPGNYRLTLDTPYDLEVISGLIKRLDNLESIKMVDIIQEYQSSQLFKINSHLNKNHGWKSSFDLDKLI